MLYRLQKRDMEKAGKVLADAFQHDPVWRKIFEGESGFDKKYAANFETPVRFCLKYGEAYAASEKLEGVAAWVPGKYADMTWWRMILSGAMAPALRIGTGVMKTMQDVMAVIMEDRHENMAGKDYLYLLVVGVATEFHGKGFGRQLIGAAIEKAESEGIPLYLETETEGNVEMYQHFGFRLIREVPLPIIELPMWEMVRD